MSRKLSTLLTEYFDQSSVSHQNVLGAVKDRPIRPSASRSSWEVHSDPERFSKRFKFDTRDRMKSFVSEVMKFEDEFRHHGEIRIEYTEVDISVYTHDVNRITELDKEYIKHVDNIHRDVLDFEY